MCLVVDYQIKGDGEIVKELQNGNNPKSVVDALGMEGVPGLLDRYRDV